MGLTRDSRSAYMREYRKRFKERHGVSPVTMWRRNNPDAAKRHREQESQRWANDPEMRERHRTQNKGYREHIKRDVFNAYGGPVCACCGETEYLFLTLDHIDNDGAVERRALAGDQKYQMAGQTFYRLLHAAGFPGGYQVLCMNCNFGKRMNGGVCPHVSSGPPTG